MASLTMDDRLLDQLVGLSIPSSFRPGVSYRIERRIGDGAMSIAYLGQRTAPEGESSVVLKVTRPSFVRGNRGSAELIVKKEAVALGRLNERVPSTPFVVRLLDTGEVIPPGGDAVPWLAVEYVHGGAMGTTLSQRIRHALDMTGFAFGPRRAANAIECIAQGLKAVHEVGVIHRDVKPENILCCGDDEEAEIFKVADFGVARSAGMKGTLGGLLVGTLGYCAPELADVRVTDVGPEVDVFSFGAVVFYLLTGEDYFPTNSLAAALNAARAPTRRSITETRGLHPEIRARTTVCKLVDIALAAATASRGSRPRAALDLAREVAPWLRSESRRVPTPPASTDSSAVIEDATSIGAWSWVRRGRPAEGFVVRSVAWDADERCLAVTSRGLSFWDGTSWADPAPRREIPAGAACFTRGLAAGRWLVGGDDGLLAVYTSDGSVDVLKGPDVRTSLRLFDGDLDDLAVFAAVEADGAFVLRTRVGRRWLKPVALEGASSIMGLARIEDEAWLVCGRTDAGSGYVSVFRPMREALEKLDVPLTGAFLAAAGAPGRASGITTGTEGHAVRYRKGKVTLERADCPQGLSTTTIDVLGRIWAASPGRIWIRRSQQSAVGEWRVFWSDPSWTSPVISLFAGVDTVISITADGGVLEGRAAGLGSSS